jgi:hypothetical protein
MENVTREVKNPKYPPIRRVVTGHDGNGVAKVLIDAPATNAKFPQAGLVSTMMWCTDGAPAKIPIGEKIEDLGARILGTAPPVKGTRFAVIDHTCTGPKPSTMSS